jgi:hypothetical protein
MSTFNPRMTLNPGLLSSMAMKDPYGNLVTLHTLRQQGEVQAPVFVYYVQGDFHQEGDIRQFIVVANCDAEAIHAYDVQLQREHKLAGKARFDLIARLHQQEKTGHWENFDSGMTFAQWWAAQPNGTCWFAGRNFTPDVCIQLTA